MSEAVRYHDQSRIRIVDRRRLMGLVFWVQSPRYWTRQRQVRVLMGIELFTQPGGRLERCWRRLRFRFRKPGPWEQWILEEEARRRSQGGHHRGTNRMN